ncbi:MAG: DMT family transporter [Paracoccaceae bacterium]
MRYGTGVVMVLTAGLLWSFQALIIRQIEVAGAWAVLTWRSVAMIPVLLVFLAWRQGGAPWPAIRKTGLAGGIGGVALVVAMGGTILAFQTTTVANAAFLLAASPFLAAILGRLILSEAVAGRTWGAIALALAGICVMVREGLAGARWSAMSRR